MDRTQASKKGSIFASVKNTRSGNLKKSKNREKLGNYSTVNFSFSFDHQFQSVFFHYFFFQPWSERQFMFRTRFIIKISNLKKTNDFSSKTMIIFKFQESIPLLEVLMLRHLRHLNRRLPKKKKRTMKSKFTLA